MKYESDGHFIYLINPPFQRKDEIKSHLSPTWFDTQKRGKGWRVPKNLHVYRELYKFFPELRINQEFMADYETSSNELKYWMNRKEFGATLDYGLRPYQNDDVSYLKTRGNCLVLNEPRTGKTPTMITVLKEIDTMKNLVICPSSLVLNWAKEFSIWYPEIKVYAVTGTKKKREEIYGNYRYYTTISSALTDCVLIISKDTWKLDKELHELQFDTAIVDEAHFLRNYKTAQSQAIFAIQANIKYALTGTPSVKHGSDVYGLLHFINPERFSSYWQFTDRYWDIHDNGWGKELGELKGNRQAELLSIMSMNSVQRKRKEVMEWLPPVTNQTIPVQMDKKQLKYYDQMFETFMATEESEEHGIDTMNKLSQLMRLRQLCLDPRLLGFKEIGAKTKALLEFAEDNTDSFVVMTTFSSYFKLIKPELEELGKKVGVIDGSTSKPNRQKLVEQFQSGKIDVLLCNIIAAGTGLTLDRADTILFLDKDFNPANNEQAQDRIVPTTEERYHPINVISLVCAGTVDERINEILDRKEDLTKIINKPEVFI